MAENEEITLLDYPPGAQVHELEARSTRTSEATESHEITSVDATQTSDGTMSLPGPDIDTLTPAHTSATRTQKIADELQYLVEFDKVKRVLDNRREDPAPEQLRMEGELMTTVRRIPIERLKRGIGEPNQPPASAWSTDLNSLIQWDKADIARFKHGLLIVENVDLPWIEALTSIGVPLTFLIEHVLRQRSKDHRQLVEKQNALKSIEDRQAVTGQFRCAHWDAVLNADHSTVQVLGRTADDIDYSSGFPLDMLCDGPEYMRLSFCEINGRRRIALVDRLDTSMSLGMAFHECKPILSPYLSTNSGGSISIKYNLQTYFSRPWKTSEIDRLFEDDLKLWWDMSADAFLRNLNLLSQELKYFTFEAINQPQISDFKTLNHDRRCVDQIVTYLDIIADTTTKNELTESNSDFRTDNERMRFVQLHSHASKMRQEFNDTFQLLIGVLSVLDSEISKTQAQRSTALTVLAAIYLPFSLATGVYGMNIAEIGNHPPKWWAAIALGMALLIVTLVVVYFVLSTKAGSERRSTDHVGTWDADHLERGSLGDGQFDVPPSRGFKIWKRPLTHG